MTQYAPLPAVFRAVLPGCFLALALGAAPARLLAIIEVGSTAPAWELEDLSGKIRRSEDFSGRIRLIVFGELYHPNTLQALKNLEKILKELPADAPKVQFFLISASSDPAEKISAQLAEVNLSPEPLVLLDRKRKALEAHDVKVIPSALVVDPKGTVGLSVSGYPFDFEDLLADGLLEVMRPGEKPSLGKTAGARKAEQRSEQEVEALRALRLARGFERRKFHELARQKYMEALERKPDLLEARLGLAGLEFTLGELLESEERYRKIIDERPGLLRAELGLGKIEIRRGQLESAWDRIRKLAALTPQDPECHYLLGQIHEGRGEKEAAMSAYKKAASLLLAEREPR